MININLLPPEYAPKKLVSPGNLLIILIVFLIGLSLITSSLKLLAAVQDYSGRVEYHNEQIKHYKQQVEDIHELGSKIKLLKTRLSLVKELLQGKDTWSDKLAELSQCLPHEGIWIDGIDIQREKKRQKAVSPKTAKSAESKEAEVPEPILAVVTGEAISVDKISQFIGALEDSNTFGKVVLNSAGSDPVRAGMNTSISFRLTVQVLSIEDTNL